MLTIFVYKFTFFSNLLNSNLPKHLNLIIINKYCKFYVIYEISVNEIKTNARTDFDECVVLYLRKINIQRVLGTVEHIQKHNRHQQAVKHSKYTAVELGRVSV